MWNFSTRAGKGLASAAPAVSFQMKVRLLCFSSVLIHVSLGNIKLHS